MCVHVLSGPDVVPGNSKAVVLALGGGRGLEKSLPGALRTERWVKRQELTRAPKSAEEIALDDKEVSFALPYVAWKGSGFHKVSRRFFLHRGHAYGLRGRPWGRVDVLMLKLGGGQGV